MMHFGNGDKPS